MKSIFACCVAAVALLVGGCGYDLGPIGHPQLKTVAVAPVINETLSYNAAAQMRALICERFTTDGTMKLVSLSEADCIVYARVTKVNLSGSNWSSNNEQYQANEWNCSVEVKYSVILPGRGKPLIADAGTSGSSTFSAGPDIEGSRINGVRQAMYDAAKTIVATVTEAW